MSEQISSVIVAVDGSNEANIATRHAALLANLYHATLQLVNVLPLYPAELSDLPANRYNAEDFDHEQQDAKANTAFAEARRVLNDLSFVSDLTVEEVRLHDTSFVRQPERAIVEHACQHKKSQLVMGARHLSEIGKWVKGSVSNAVIHHAKGPVTILHADAHMTEMASIGRILLPTDGSKTSVLAARLAGDLARSGNIPVEIIYCQPSGEVPPLDNGEQEAQRVLTDTRDALGDVPAGIHDTVLHAERYGEAIVEQAHKCDNSPVIVMGRRGLGHWRESLLGSVSQKVIELAPCPVTVVV
ncbi:universal stress protein [Halomonas vilamensis]|uniref:Universal stress protein n=1 Tax=Vreelandella vilamensis TaxID=531309 RepID=A0ABU1H1E2_9GAMM|nr:universal stress protein [Halomonas vilamensis]MDR5897636.1 universal stress protein [Halomonas vilamensis]